KPGLVTFVCEQDGPAERELKTVLLSVLASCPNVQCAYLARVTYGQEDTSHVALCLRAPEDLTLVRRIGDRFRETFGASEHVDILCLRDDGQEQELRQVCRSFHEAG